MFMLKNHMLMKLVCSISALAALLPICAAAAESGTVHILPGINISGEHEYKAVRLIPSIYNVSKSDLSDILILDEAGNAVPYFINNYETVTTSEAAAAYPLTLANAFVKDGASYYDYCMEFDEQKDVLATSVSVRSSNSTFAKSLELRGGYDGVNWDYITTDNLYRVDENEKLSITFEKPLKYTYYRFKISDNAEKIAFDGVSLEYSENTVNQVFFTETASPPGGFYVEEQNNTTLIKLYGLKNVKISEMTIETNNMFKRPVYYGGRSKTLYNLSFGGNVYRDTALDWGGYSSGTDILEVRIENGDDKPISIDGIMLTYFADDVIFKGENGAKYALSFGDETVSRAPVYDIANYKDLILKDGYDVLTLDNVSVVEIEPEPQKPDYSIAFNIVVILVSVLLGAVILVRIRR